MKRDPQKAPSIEAVDSYFAACVRQALAREPWPEWPADWDDADTQQRAIKRSEFHGVAVLLTNAPKPFPAWPYAVAEALREEARLATLWEETHRMSLSELLTRLADAGIATLVMKGTALAYLHYDPPATRRRGDTDLLVRAEDVSATREILQQMDYVPRSDPHGLYFQETWIFSFGGGLEHAIDLHWEPADRPLLQRILKTDEFVDRAIAVPRIEKHVMAPRALLMLVHGAINQAWHVARGFYVDGAKVLGGRRLIWSVDYAHLTRDFSDQDWQELMEFCQTRDACSLVYTALSGAEQDLGLEFPPEVMQRIKQAPSQSPTHSYIATPDTLSDVRTDLVTADSAWKKLRILGKAIISPRDHLIGKYPHLSHWPTPVLQIRRYADMVGRLFNRAEKS